MSRICLYYRQVPERDRWVRGDRFVRPLVRRVIRGKRRVGGIDKVFVNLCLGLDRLGIDYAVNPPFKQLRPADRVAVLGRGRWVMAGYDRPNPIVAGNGLMTHPSEWPSFCDDYQVAAYLQPSTWANDVFAAYFGARSRVWPVGIDTHSWRPATDAVKAPVALVYDKIRWDRETLVPELLAPVRRELTLRGFDMVELRYGFYEENAYRAALRRASFMVFLCEHESQGLAYQECLASGVPVLAWDQGWCLDPERARWGQPHIPATSVPYFDERCGLRFRDIGEFPDRLGEFLDRLRGGQFAPRDYMLENLTLERCSAHFVQLLDEAQGTRAAA